MDSMPCDCHSASSCSGSIGSASVCGLWARGAVVVGEDLIDAVEVKVVSIDSSRRGDPEKLSEGGRSIDAGTHISILSPSTRCLSSVAFNVSAEEKDEGARTMGGLGCCNCVVLALVVSAASDRLGEEDCGVDFVGTN